jgi:4-hydroxy-tetrahydrodipicolinate synthase
MSEHLKGVWAASLTPLRDDLSVDLEHMLNHHRWLLANGCDGIAVLGTTGEANSFSLPERRQVIDAVAGSGIPLTSVIVGTGCCALPDTVELTRAVLDIGCRHLLMLPPFYYKGLDDDALFGSFDAVIQAVGDTGMKIVIYDFPAMTGLEMSTDLLVRLNAAHPQTVVGVKDSSGNWPAMKAVAEAIPGFRTFAGTETYLLEALRVGGAGCISATANVTSALCGPVYAAHLAGDAAAADAAQAEASAVRAALQQYPLIPGLKEIMARHTGDGTWRNMRPPVMPLPAERIAALNEAIGGVGLALAQAA